MRLLVFSDLHLDSPFTQDGAEVASARRAELRDTLRRITELSDHLGVDALLCAGDLYEHERFTPDTAHMLKRRFGEISEIPVLLAPGNHDWYGPPSIYATTQWSPNVHVYTSEAFESYDGLEGVRIWGFAHQRPAGTPNPLRDFRVEGRALHLGLFHGSEASAWFYASEMEQGKERHAPFGASDIPQAGLAHCLVGHYHRRIEKTHHTYSGAPAPLAFGVPREGGAVEIEFDQNGELIARKWHTVTQLRMHDLHLDVSGCTDFAEIEDRLMALLGDREGLSRITVRGELAEHVRLDLTALGSRAGDGATVRVGALHHAYDLETIAQEGTVRGQFVRDVQESDAFESEEERQRVMITGLRALDGRDDLEVI